MDITKAKKVIELSKDNRKILVTVYDNQVSSCVEMEAKKYCESCQCDEQTCGEWIEYLKGKGYSATEVELGELGLEESLPKFLEERQVKTKPEVSTEPEPAVEKREETVG
jgi:hypothetical protein